MNGESPIEKYNATLTSAERTESARRAGVASGEARRKYRRMADLIKRAMVLEVDDPSLKDYMVNLGIEPTRANAIVIAAMGKAAAGDIEAARFVRDTVGEKPTEQYVVGMNDKPIKSIDLTGLSDDELAALADSCED